MYMYVYMCVCVVCVVSVWGCLGWVWVKIRQRGKLGKMKSECRLQEPFVHFTNMRLPSCLCRPGLGHCPHRLHCMLNVYVYMLGTDYKPGPF